MCVIIRELDASTELIHSVELFPSLRLMNFLNSLGWVVVFLYRTISIRFELYFKWVSVISG